MGEEINVYVKTLLEGIAVPCVIFLTQIIVRFVTTYMNKLKEQQKNEELNKMRQLRESADRSMKQFPKFMNKVKKEYL